MHTHTTSTQENNSRSVAAANTQVQSSEGTSLEVADHQAEAVAQGKLQGMADDSPQVVQQRSFQAMANNSPQAKQAVQLQAMADNYSATSASPLQKKQNNTGLPDNLKSGIENLSGYSMDDVNVHYNSAKPKQLQAHAYAQGTDIHLGSGQEKHLPHEAWHVVQQKQGRVQATTQLKSSVPVNDDTSLEKEADLMGNKAVSMGSTPASEEKPRQLKSFTSTIIQRNGGDGEGSKGGKTTTDEESGSKKAKKPAEERDEKAWKAVEDLEKEVKEKPVSADSILSKSRWALSWAAGLGWKALFSAILPWLNRKINEETGIQPQTSPSFYQALNGLTIYYANLHGPMNKSEGGVNASAPDFSIQGLTAELGINSFSEFWQRMENFQNLKLKVNINAVEAKKIRIQSPTMDVTLDLSITDVGLKGRGGMIYTILQILSKGLPYYGEKRSIKEIVFEGLQGAVSIGNIQIDIHGDSWINTDADKEENTFKPADTKEKKKPDAAELAKQEAKFREERQAINKDGALGLQGRIELKDFLAAGVMSDKTGKHVARTSVGGIKATKLDVSQGEKGATVGSLSVGHSSATLENDHVSATVGDVEAREVTAIDFSKGISEIGAIEIGNASMGRSHIDADIGGGTKKINAGLGAIKANKIEAQKSHDLAGELRDLSIAPSALEAHIAGKDASVVADIGAASIGSLGARKGDHSVVARDTRLAPSHIEATSKSKTLKNGKAFSDEVPEEIGTDKYTTDNELAVKAAIGDVSIGNIRAQNNEKVEENASIDDVAIKGIGAKANLSKRTELAAEGEGGLSASTSLLDSTKAGIDIGSVSAEKLSAKLPGKKEATLKKLELAKIAASHSSNIAKGKTPDETSTLGLGKATLSELTYKDPGTALQVGEASLGGVKAGKGSKGLSLETESAKVNDVHLRSHTRKVTEETVHDDRLTLSTSRDVTEERQDLLKKLNGTRTKAAAINVGSAEILMTGAGHSASEKAIRLESLGAAVKDINVASYDNSPGLEKAKNRAIHLDQLELKKTKFGSLGDSGKTEIEAGMEINRGSVSSKPGAKAFIDIDKVDFDLGEDGDGQVAIDLTLHDKGKEGFTGTPIGIKDNDPVHIKIPVNGGIIAFDNVKPQLEKTGLRSFVLDHFLNIRVTNEHVEHHLLKRKTVTETPPRLKIGILGIDLDKTYLKDLGVTQEQQAADPVLLAKQLKQVGEKGGINLISFLKHTVQAQVQALLAKLSEKSASSEAFMFGAAIKGLGIKQHADLAQEKEKVVDKGVTRENRKGDSGPHTVEKTTTASDTLTEVNLKEAEIEGLSLNIDGGLSLSDLMPEISSPDVAGLKGDALKGVSGSKGTSSASSKKRTLEDARQNSMRGVMTDPTGRQYTRVDRGIVDQDNRGNSCGFLTLNTTREALRDSLVQTIEAGAHPQLQAMLNFIGDEIQNTIIHQGHLEFGAHNIQTLSQAYTAYNLRENARADLIRDVRAFRGPAAPQMNLNDCAVYLTSPAVTGGAGSVQAAALYAQVVQVSQQFNAARTTLDQTFRDPVLAVDYLRSNLLGQMLGTGTARAWAIADNAELHIWTHVDENDPNSPAIAEISPGDVTPGGRRIDMLHTWNRRHFQELLRH